MGADRVALIVATELECLEILKSLAILNKYKEGHFEIYKGLFSDKETVVVISGPGKANAGAASVIAILEFEAKVVINFGIGGAFISSGLGVGDLALCTEDIYVEEGVVTRNGHKDLTMIGLELIPERAIYNKIPFSMSLVEKTEEILLKNSIKFKKGRFITVSTVTGTSDRAEKLERQFNAICESMEGAAVGQIALSFGTPALQIRGISNMVEDRDRRKWKIKDASTACQRAVLKIINEL